MRFIAFVLVSVVVIVKHGYCRNCRGEQPIRTCENLCDENNKCKIRAAILLPSNTSYSASLPTVEPVLELALQSEAVRAVFPSWLEFEWKTYDVVDCDAAYAVISSIDAYNDCAHLFLGPSCDFALASVARIAKFLATSGGTPVMTTGGFTFDFVQPKKTCDHEFYMLVRTGAVGFQDVAYFIIKLMEEYKWRQLQLITEPDSQMSVGGKSTCHLMMRTLANSVKDKGYHYSPWDIDSTGGKNYTDNLKYYLGYKYTSNFDWARTALLYETPAFESEVGATGGFLLASTIHQYMIFEGIDIFGWELQMHNDLKDQLLQVVGNNYARSKITDNSQSILNFNRNEYSDDDPEIPRLDTQDY